MSPVSSHGVYHQRCVGLTTSLPLVAVCVMVMVLAALAACGRGARWRHLHPGRVGHGDAG